MYLTYHHFIEVNEFRDEARKSLEDLLTKELDEIAMDNKANDTRSVAEVAVSMQSEWDAFEAELGVTRGESAE